MVKYQTVADEFKLVTKSWKCLEILRKINMNFFKKVLTMFLQRDKISLLSEKFESELKRTLKSKQ